MHTITPPVPAWGPPSTSTDKYKPTRRNGKRVPGWEDCNITLLAHDLGISFRYLLAVLCGQRNCTLALLQQTAQALGLPLPEVITRMERAYHLRLEAAVSPPDRLEQQAERRRLRSERRALANQETNQEP